jgi:xylan 1,4-beta-xylosidase
MWSEFNATYMSEREITDSVYMGAWLAKTISQADGKVAMMSYWTFSDVFEEQGVIRVPFFGGFGLIAIDHLPKPSFNVFRLLHTLGDERVPEKADDVPVTKKRDGTLVLAAWNLVEPGVSAPPKSITFTFQGVKGNDSVRISRVDHAHGDVLAAYDKMGAHLPIRVKRNCDSCEKRISRVCRRSSTCMAVPSPWKCLHKALRWLSSAGRTADPVTPLLRN